MPDDLRLGVGINVVKSVPRKVGVRSRTGEFSGYSIGRGLTTGSLRVLNRLMGSSVGSGYTDGTLTITGAQIALSGSTIGTGTTTGSLTITGAAVLLSGSTVGTGTTSGSLRVQNNLQGSTTGVGLINGSLFIANNLQGSTTGIGLTSGSLTVNAGTPTYDPDAVTAFSAMTTQPNSARKQLYSDMISGLKADGVWSRLGWLSVPAHDQQAQRINLVNPAQMASAVNEPTFIADRGYQGDAVQSFITYGNTYQALYPSFTQNDNSVFAYCSLQGPSSARRPHVGQEQGSFRCSIEAGFGAATTLFRAGDSISGTVTSGDSRVGFRISTRIDPNTKELYVDGVKNSVAQVSGGIGSLNAVVLKNGTSTFSDDRIGTFGFGMGLNETQANALRNRVMTYLTAIGAN